MDAIAPRILPSKKVNQGRVSKEERANELYPTHPALTRALLYSGEDIPQTIVEPTCGLGHMVRPLEAAGRTVIASDIENYGWGHRVRNFFDVQEAEADICITNPPFSLSNQFVRHGLALYQKVIILNRLAFLEGKGRSDIIDRHLARVYPIVERPPFMHRWTKIDGIWTEWQGKRAPSAMACAWFVFTREHPTQTTVKRLSWKAYA